MGLWTLLLLLLHLVCVSLPAPANVSITSYNMEHILRFWPDPRTPPDARFTVQIHSTRKQRWKTVAECAELTAGQTCNLTSKLKDSFGLYVAQVQAFRTNQTSSWTTSNLFHPLADTVLGPPEVSVSGCGNCLVLQIRDGPVQLKDLQREMELNVRRTRDGQETVISYLQPGVEYCVSVSFKSLINRNSVPSARRCAFTSPPPPQHSCTPLQITLFLRLSVKRLINLAVLVKVSLELLRRHLNRSVHTKNTLLGIKMAGLVTLK
uniref:Interferon alpha/beta receptor 2-like n=1 Tax=Poecilia latipinna TaxID=48699 RepID=A0A3B3UQW0_9TELE